MLLLAIDTSTPTVTAGVVSLLRPHELIGPDGRPAGDPVDLLAERTVTDAFAHAEQLMPLIQQALAESGHRLADLEAVVVGLGPGPFTGLRVGIATAQALGDALDIPVHGVGSHDGTFNQEVFVPAQTPRSQALVVTDARRREVYVSAYGAMSTTAHAGPAVLAPTAVPAWVAARGLEPERILGAGANLLAEALPGMEVIPAGGSLCLGLVGVAVVALLTGVVPGPLTPLYLRRPDATEPAARKSVLHR